MLFQNDKLDEIKVKLAELNTKKGELIQDIAELNSMLSVKVDLFIAGKITEADIKAAETLLFEKKAELQDVDSLIERVMAVKKKVAFESLPLIAPARDRKRDALQKKYDALIPEIIEARNAFIRKLAEGAQIAEKMGDTNYEYNDIMRELGGKVSTYGKQVNKVAVFNRGWASAGEQLGITEQLQIEAGLGGKIPDWAKEKTQTEGDK